MVVAFFWALISIFIPWYYVSAQFDIYNPTKAKNESYVVNNIYWWREIFVQTYIEDSREDSYSGQLNINYIDFDHVRDIFIISLIFTVLAAVAAILTAGGSCYIYARGRFRLFGTFTSIFFGVWNILFCLAALGSYGAVAKEIRHDYPSPIEVATYQYPIINVPDDFFLGVQNEGASTLFFRNILGDVQLGTNRVVLPRHQCVHSVNRARIRLFDKTLRPQSKP